MQTTLDVPNLDAADDDELVTLAETFETLARYARCKACAMRERLAGRITLAIRLEETCDKVYGDLPDWARW